MALLGLARRKRNLLKKKPSSATLDAQSTATELGQTPDMRRDVPMDPLACPAAESAREKNIGRRRTASQKKIKHFLGISCQY